MPKKGGAALAETFIFRRIEKKYRITPLQYEKLMALIGDRLIPDVHGKSTVCNIYLETPDFLLIRNSMEAKTYKEKLRLRSYGIPKDDTSVFLELKKKYKGVVYKRRVALSFADAMKYINGGSPPFDSQIMREIDYAMHFYKEPKPRVILCYERDAYYDITCPALRLTFDTHIRYRADDLKLEHGSLGREVLPPDVILLEIKTDGGMPLWLSRALDECKIFPARFSKYATSYHDLLETKKEEKKGEFTHA